jgi:viroplasmin and RNaseH domain-containing protein
MLSIWLWTLWQFFGDISEKKVLFICDKQYKLETEQKHLFVTHNWKEWAFFMNLRQSNIVTEVQSRKQAEYCSSKQSIKQQFCATALAKYLYVKAYAKSADAFSILLAQVCQKVLVEFWSQ